MHVCLLWLLLQTSVLPSMASQPAKPDPDSPEYQQQVSKSIKTLVSGQRPRDPIMSGASTGRLIIEGVVENLRIYRLYKEEKAREMEGKKKGAREKEKTNGNSHGHKRRERHRPQSPRHERGRCRSNGSNGEASRYLRHHSTDTYSNRGEHRRRKHHRHRLEGEGRNKNHKGLRDRDNNQKRVNRLKDLDSLYPSTRSPTREMMNATNAQPGPDGAPFGSRPARGKGVSIAAHAKTIYRNIMAEQDAGSRKKGFAEKHMGAFFQRWDTKDAMKGVGKERKPLVSADSEGEKQRQDRQERRPGRRRRPKTYECEKELGVEDNDSKRYRNAGASVAARAESLIPAQSARSKRQPTPLVQEPRSRPIRSVQEPAPFVRSASVRAAQNEGREHITSPSRPAIRVQSPTPPELEHSVRPLTPVVGGPISSSQSRGLRGGGSETPVRNISFHHYPPPPLVPVPALATETSCIAALTVVDTPVITVPDAPQVLPPPTVDSAHDALMASILSGAAKLRKVPGEEKKDETCTNYYTEEHPVYEETPRSHEVEALEHAQATEEKERTKGEEELSSTYSNKL